MTKRWTSGIARRPLVAGLLGVLGIAAVGGAAIELPSLFRRRRYKPTPYDDLLDRLPDRENANRLGAALLRDYPDVDSDAQKIAKELRARLGDKRLADVMESDIAADRLLEIGGWVVPTCFAQLCALSAKAS